mgnify:CR=1 FL=1
MTKFFRNEIRQLCWNYFENIPLKHRKLLHGTVAFFIDDIVVHERLKRVIIIPKITWSGKPARVGSLIGKKGSNVKPLKEIVQGTFDEDYEIEILSNRQQIDRWKSVMQKGCCESCGYPIAMAGLQPTKRQLDTMVEKWEGEEE